MSGLRRSAGLLLLNLASGVFAQSAVEHDDEARHEDPDVVAAEELVLELRDAAESARQDQNAALPEQVDALYSDLEALTLDPHKSLPERLATQRVEEEEAARTEAE